MSSTMKHDKSNASTPMELADSGPPQALPTSKPLSNGSVTSSSQALAAAASAVSRDGLPQDLTQQQRARPLPQDLTQPPQQRVRPPTTRIDKTADLGKAGGPHVVKNGLSHGLRMPTTGQSAAAVGRLRETNDNLGRRAAGSPVIGGPKSAPQALRGENKPPVRGLHSGNPGRGPMDGSRAYHPGGYVNSSEGSVNSRRKPLNGGSGDGNGAVITLSSSDEEIEVSQAGESKVIADEGPQAVDVQAMFELAKGSGVELEGLMQQLKGQLGNEETQLILLQKLRLNQQKPAFSAIENGHRAGLLEARSSSPAQRVTHNPPTAAGAQPAPPPLIRGAAATGSASSHHPGNPYSSASSGKTTQHHYAPSQHQSSSAGRAHHHQGSSSTPGGSRAPPPLVTSSAGGPQRVRGSMSSVSGSSHSNHPYRQSAGSAAGYRRSPVPSGGSGVSQQQQQQSNERRQAAAKLALRKNLEKTLLGIQPPKPPPPEMNFIPNQSSHEFTLLLGLEEAVKKILTGEKKEARLVYSPFTCVQCFTDFTPVWKRDSPGSKNVICERCMSTNQKRALKAEHTKLLKGAFMQALQQEQEIDKRLASSSPMVDPVPSGSHSSAGSGNLVERSSSSSSSAASAAAAANIRRQQQANSYLQAQQQAQLQAAYMTLGPHAAAAAAAAAMFGPAASGARGAGSSSAAAAAAANDLQRKILLDMIDRNRNWQP